jgi:hypothetical protein
MKPLPKMLRLTALVVTLGLGLAALCFWMMEGLDRPAQAIGEADFKVVDHGCSLPASVINVSEDVSLRCAVSVHNNGPDGPLNAEVTVDVDISPGCTVTPSSVSVSVLVPVSVNVDVFPPWMTVRCAQPGSHQLDHTSIIEAGMPDPDEGNNSRGPTPLLFEAVTPGVISVEIDIKPGSFPNSINPNSKGVIPVAILTTEDFDATTVDADTVRFGPADAEKVHKRAHVEDADGDGDLDLVLHFRTRETDIQSDDTEACLTGRTTVTDTIWGCDSVRTVPQKDM